MNIPLKDKIIINLALAGLLLAIAMLTCVVKLWEMYKCVSSFARRVKPYKERVRRTTPQARF